jgi:hypothetical protein
MATYREIKGLTVPYLDADLPSASASTEEGGVWYNSATGKLRAFVAFDTWATSAPKTNATEAPAGAGIQTAGVAFGGYTTANTGLTEEYNGSVWGSGGNLLVAVKQHTGCGTQTAGLSTAGAGPVDETEEYDGTCWAASNDLNTARRALTGFGLQTAGLCTGGLAGSSDPRANTEVYNGTTWANDDDLTTPRGDGSQAGTLQAGLVAGGSPASGLNSNTDTTEEYTQSITAQTVTDS